MDQLTAYQILGLVQGSTLEEIKAAYATLSKQYHPEEDTEKFQEIHEAYMTLTRRRRRSVEHSYHEERYVPQEKQAHIPIEETLQETPQEDTKQEELDFGKVARQQETMQKAEYEFDDAIEKARRQEEEILHELVLEAGAELKVLASPKYSSNLKAYRALFGDKKYEPIVRKAEFLEKLCEVLETTKLKKNIYDYIIDFYRLRGMQPNELSPIGLRLYQVLDDRVGIKKKPHPAVYGGVVAAILTLFRAMRPIIRQNEILSRVVLIIMAVVLFGWLFKTMKDKKSVLFSQFVISILVAISQFVVIMCNGYGTLFGSVDTGNSVAAVIFLLACVWLLIVVVVAVIRGIIRLFNG